MRKISLQEQRIIELGIMDDIHSFCVQHDLRYSMAGGTLLGAVRHRGFIPWDDDIDIIMPRSDYETLIQSYRSDKNELHELRNDGSCVELFLKVSRKGTRLVDKTLGRQQWGISIDIFPIDGSREDCEEEAARIKQMREKLARICPYYKSAEKKYRLTWFLKYCIKRLIYFYPHSVRYLKHKIDAFAYNKDLTGGERAGVKIGGHGIREMIDSKVFLSTTLMDFEDRQYFGLIDFESFLKSHYGDFMQLPPEEKRVLPHYYDAYIEE